MFYVLLSLLLIYPLYKLNKAYPGFKKFNIENAGVVTFVIAAFAVGDLVNYVSGNGPPKARPSILQFLALAAAYGAMYRPNTLRLIGLLKAYPDEKDGWKFTATLTSAFVLASLLIWKFSLVEATVCTIVYWHLFFYATASHEAKREVGSRLGSKLLITVACASMPFITYLNR